MVVEIGECIDEGNQFNTNFDNQSNHVINEKRLTYRALGTNYWGILCMRITNMGKILFNFVLILIFYGDVIN